MSSPGGGPESAWVFAYGSLIWRQDFPFLDYRRARIDGWTRRLWQGSHDHRGVPGDPGRVATIVRSPGDACHGCALLVGHEVFEHLDHREKNGYERIDLQIHLGGASVEGVTYVAPADNHAFLGDATPAEIVTQVRRCRGESGSNLEYVLELARALRALDIEDPHIHEIEAWLLSRESA
jgi:cation transport regulator ChaC